MPLSLASIEEVGHKRFVAEVELGGISAVRKTVRADSWGKILREVAKAAGCEEELRDLLDEEEVEEEGADASLSPSFVTNDGTSPAPPIPANPPPPAPVRKK